MLIEYTIYSCYVFIAQGPHSHILMSGGGGGERGQGGRGGGGQGGRGGSPSDFLGLEFWPKVIILSL